MWMRVVRTHGYPEASTIEDAVDRYRQEDLPSIQPEAGFRGLALGENHAGGSIASVSFWDSEHAMRHSQRFSAEALERIRRDVGGRDRVLVDYYEITHASDLSRLSSTATAHMRLVRFAAIARAKIAPTADSYRQDALRDLDRIPGAMGIVIGTRRETGSLAAISFWESQRTMNDAEDLCAEAQDHAYAASRPRLAALVDRLQITIATRLDRVGDAKNSHVAD